MSQLRTEILFFIDLISLIAVFIEKLKLKFSTTINTYFLLFVEKMGFLFSEKQKIGFSS